MDSGRHLTDLVDHESERYIAFEEQTCMPFLKRQFSARCRADSEDATTSLAHPVHAKPFSFPLVRGIMLFHANSAFALVVAAGLHDLLQGLLHSVPVIRLCGNSQ